MTGAARAWGVNAALALASLVSLGPLLWMLSVSFMAPGEASQFPPPLFPSDATLDNYRALLSALGMGRSFLNSLCVASVSTILSLCFNVTAG